MERCYEWQRYIQQSFDDNTRKTPDTVITGYKAEDGPSILKSEKAIQQSKTRKTPDPMRSRMNE